MHLVLDTENSIFQKGNPFSRRNVCCAIGWAEWSERNNHSGVLKLEHGGNLVTADTLTFIQKMLYETELLIGFNLKYDLHWLRRYGLDVPTKLRLWDVQSVQFIIENQRNAYPSMAKTSEFYGLQPKFDAIEGEYWDKGIDTTNIPWEVVQRRAHEDVLLTYDLYKRQKDKLPTYKERLVSLTNQDLRMLAEMEWHGLRYDTKSSLEQSTIIKGEIESIDSELTGLFGDHPFNWSSNDHGSVCLYGGVIRFRVRTPYDHTYKGGAKAGTTETRYKHSVYEVSFPRLVEPLEKSALKKPGYWSTAADVLKQLRGSKHAKRVIGLMTRRSDLEKLNSTYLQGFPAKIEEMDWEPGTIHGQLNQSVVVTGRLSSSGPNMQNLLEEAQALVKSRYT